MRVIGTLSDGVSHAAHTCAIFRADFACFLAHGRRTRAFLHLFLRAARRAFGAKSAAKCASFDAEVVRHRRRQRRTRGAKPRNFSTIENVEENHRKHDRVLSASINNYLLYLRMHDFINIRQRKSITNAINLNFQRAKRVFLI